MIPTPVTFSDHAALADLILKAGGGIGALYVFIKGLLQYRHDQAWRRNEFLAREMKDFNSDVMIQRVMQMLDWPVRRIGLFSERQIAGERFVVVTRDMLRTALRFHEEESEPRFTREEVAIRDHFDHFFNNLDRFGHFVEAGLIKPEEIRVYLKYWINSVEQGMAERDRAAVYNYIISYKFSGTRYLFKKLGSAIP